MNHQSVRWPLGGIRRWKDGRNMPDVHATLFEYGNLPVYLRLNLGTNRPRSIASRDRKAFLK